ncbi:heparan-alpha-glucosaminide N-acetyltransferase-like isoform X2 [Zingiber officinale]|uniref:heparan-alpha-glucosaminide N-acetyltransferase-like isoform X2 n=1 Tax=Zingiber officinale TaxID=94328 RepID=UPI001C4D4FDE|nr:heparan-alpha-glucosaminide N-acetyltransferase-like isoform X2 [Zingiber officinale]XP_042464198.1 heparan-alpha-glucosaminide N-acetyltransferase-like isoform X2 [Zingiber officinale]XP_042464200.1 heparan-alpha-glucosaminide N-acetyltransferase-like isoform X2 [Zingiber officinale]
MHMKLMVFVDYAGSVLPYVGHAPWDGVHLADFVMPFFLFIAGISVSIVYKNKANKVQSTRKAVVRAVKLFVLGVLLQGGYFHVINSLTFGVDIDRIRVFGILQRIAIGYIVAALCEIWLSSAAIPNSGCRLFKDYYFQWIIMFVLSSIYVGLLHGIYVPDWKYEPQEFALSSPSMQIRDVIEKVKCGVRGDLGPACNAAGMIDRKLLGIKHLYIKPVFRNLKECRTPGDENGAYTTYPSWCQAPFDPEGILSSLTAVVSCIFGLQFGHTLVLWEDHKSRLTRWLLFSLATSGLGIILACIGVPLNKSLYTISYMFLTTGVAVATFCALYVLVDIYEYKWPTYVFQWMGRHSLSIFVLVASNIAVIAIQGFYWRNPKNNIVHWIVSLVRKYAAIDE